MKPDSDLNTGPLDNKVVMLEDGQRQFVLSPMRLMYTLLICVFTIETIVMVTLEYKEPVGWKETLIDSSVLTLTLFFILYYTLFKPLVLLIASYKRKESELWSRQKHLEQVIEDCSRSEAALYETKAILQAAMDQSPTGIAIADAPHGSLRYVNDAGLFIRGSDRNTLVEGIGIDQYVASWQVLDFDGTPLEAEEIPLTRAIRYGETCGREFLIRRSNNDDRTVQVNAAPIRDENGEVVAGIAVFWDITDRKQAEEELKKSEEKFRGLFESAQDGILLTSSQGVILELNEAFARLHGYTVEDMLSKELKELDDPENASMVPERLSRLDAGEPLTFQVKHYCKDGHLIPLEVSASQLKIGDEKFILGFHRDITDRLQVEEELKGYQNHLETMIQVRSRALEETTRRLKQENEEHIAAKKKLFESEEHFRQIFDQSEDAIVLISPQDSAIIDVNPTAERIFRKQRTELLAGGLSALCDLKGYKSLLSALEQITHDSVPGRIERFECTFAPDVVRVLSFRGKIITLQGAEVVYSTFRDITSRVRLEEQALEIQARLIQANRMTSLGTMVSSVAHEINNPNNFLLMNAGIIKRAWDDIAPVIEEYAQSKGDFSVAQSRWSEARSFLPDAIEGIQQGALRISDIVGTLKDFGRDDRFKKESIADVNDVVQLSASILSHLISSSTHRFTLELVEGLPLVRGSARQLEQVVINLIQNALQALPDRERGVSVATGLDPESGQVLIRVSDEGGGIAPEIAARIMEPFFTTRLERGGTGLGLAISSTIVKEHGGSIEFCSEPGKGTTFTVRLSRAASSEN